MVLVTTSACSKGEGMALAATSPLTCAMSASRYAFTSSHTCATGNGVLRAVPVPADISGVSLPSAPYLLHASVVDEAGVRGGAGDDETGTEKPRCHLQLVIVNQPRGWLQRTDRQTAC